MKTAIQTYNLVPRLIPVGALLVGLLLGFFVAYNIAPNVYLNAEPVNLSQDYQQEYVKMVAWQYYATGDKNNAVMQLSKLGDPVEVIANMMANQALMNDPNFAPHLLALNDIAKGSDDSSQLAKISGSFPRGNATPILCFLLLAIVVGGLLTVDAIIPLSTFMPIPGNRPAPSSQSQSVVSGLEADRRKVVDQLQAQAQAAPRAAAPIVQGVSGTPVATHMFAYLLNDDNYDESATIETASGQFLGEMGGGISKALDNGKPKKVTALEFWVFDAVNTLTLTKVLASDYALNDPSLRAELSAKGELVPARPGTIVTLDAPGVFVQSRLIDISYGTGNSPANSFFDRVTFEMSAWAKAPGSGTPMGTPVVTTTTYTAPPSQPLPTFTPPPSGSASANLGSYPPPPPPPPSSDPYSQDTSRLPPPR